MYGYFINHIFGTSVCGFSQKYNTNVYIKIRIGNLNLSHSSVYLQLLNPNELLMIYFLPWVSVVFTSIIVKVFLFCQPISLETCWRVMILMYTSLHVDICFNRVNSTGHRESLKLPAGRRTVLGRASADVIIRKKKCKIIVQ